MFKFFRKDKSRPEAKPDADAVTEPAAEPKPGTPAEPAPTAEPVSNPEPTPAPDPTPAIEPTPATESAPAIESATATEPPPAGTVEVQAPSEQPEAALEQRLERSRGQFSSRLKAMFRIRKKIDDELLEELETLLLTSDVGAEASLSIIDTLTQRIKRRELDDPEAVLTALRDLLTDLVAPCERPMTLDAREAPFVILIVGVNGAGKTTTIGKLARRFKDAGLNVMLAAGDTFRAAAVEQLQRWGERNDVPVIAQSTGADSASVIFDALQAARARGADILIADTAGRLHTQSNLMQELEKIKRVLAKIDPDAPHEVLLVLDGGTGQNALSQTRQFHQAIGVTGLAVTKLDGTAKGGVLFALCREFGLPVRFIGVGEQATDLRSFQAREFVDAILPEHL